MVGGSWWMQQHRLAAEHVFVLLLFGEALMLFRRLDQSSKTTDRTTKKSNLCLPWGTVGGKGAGGGTSLRQEELESRSGW